MLSLFPTHRLLGLGAGETQAGSHPDQTVLSSMKRGNSFAKNPRKDSRKSEGKCKVRSSARGREVALETISGVLDFCKGEVRVSGDKAKGVEEDAEPWQLPTLTQNLPGMPYL